MSLCGAHLKKKTGSFIIIISRSNNTKPLLLDSSFQTLAQLLQLKKRAVFLKDKFIYLQCQELRSLGEEMTLITCMITHIINFRAQFTNVFCQLSV